MDCVDVRDVRGFGASIVDSDDESRGKGAGSDGGFALKGAVDSDEGCGAKGAVKAAKDEWSGLRVEAEDPR